MQSEVDRRTLSAQVALVTGASSGLGRARACALAEAATDVAALVVWTATAPQALVLNEAVVSPLQEKGWP